MKMASITKNITKLAKSIPSYRPPRLVDHNGNMEKRWYIDYYVLDQDGNRIRRQFTGMNKYKNKSMRYEFSYAVMAEIRKALEKDYRYLGTRKRKNQSKRSDQRNFSLAEWCEKVALIKKNELSHSGWNYYSRFAKRLKELPEGQKSLSKISRKDVVRIQNELIQSGLSNKSVNNYMAGVLSPVLKMGVDEELISKNPYSNIRKLKFETGKHYPYSPDQLQKIEAFTRKNMPLLHLFISTLYYTLARPGEIKLLKCGDIYEDKILIKAENSKIKKNRYVALTGQLKTLMESHGVFKGPKDYFIFGKTTIVSKTKAYKNFYYDHHKRMLDQLNLNDKPYDLYSYKHTGAIALVNSGVDIKYIQQQCGHSSVAQTDHYLKDIGGLRNNDALIKSYPDFGKL